MVSGVGKSGYIGRKIAATLCSTGTPAVFLHPSEALHGDLGIYAPGDPTILISKSGATAEIVRLIPVLRHFQSPLIAIVGNLTSPLAEQADVVLNAGVTQEADPLNVVPTASTTVALAIGDALASVLLYGRRFTMQDFARFHPQGQLGRALWLHVADVMHPLAHVACVDPNYSLREIVIRMTELPLGAACVIDDDGRLVGILTDGDIRRALQNHDDIRNLTANDVMTANPITIARDATLRDAVRLMEERPSQIYVLPVVDPATQLCQGLMRLHDVYQAQIE
jgi:arabinose-5-phosphate isomerase